jgi:hypothetical protein
VVIIFTIWLLKMSILNEFYFMKNVQLIYIYIYIYTGRWISILTNFFFFNAFKCRHIFWLCIFLVLFIQYTLCCFIMDALSTCKHNIHDTNEFMSSVAPMSQSDRFFFYIQINYFITWGYIYWWLIVLYINMLQNFCYYIFLDVFPK